MKTMARWQKELLSLLRCNYLFMLETPHVGTNRAYVLLNRFLKKMHTLPYIKARRAARKDPLSMLDVGLPPTKLM